MNSDELNTNEINETPVVVTETGERRPEARRMVKPVMVLGCLVVGLVAALSGFKYFQSLSLKAATYTASLRLPGSLSAYVGSTISVPLMLDTQGANVTGVDVLMKFDITKLELVSIEPTASSVTNLKYFAPADTAGGFKAADVIYKANSVGLVEFSAVTIDYGAQQVLPAFNGVTTLAVMKYRIKTTGSTVVSLESVPGSRTDTNIVVSTTEPVDALSSALQITN